MMWSAVPGHRFGSPQPESGTKKTKKAASSRHTPEKGSSPKGVKSSKALLMMRMMIFIGFFSEKCEGM